MGNAFVHDYGSNCRTNGDVACEARISVFADDCVVDNWIFGVGENEK